MKIRLMIVLCCLSVLVLSASIAVADSNERASLRDPFKPLLSPPPPPDDPIPSQKQPVSPLQEYDLKQFRVIGIVVGELGNYAALLAPDGKTYMITVGAAIGRYDGNVVEISENIVLVREILQYPDGLEKEEETPLHLNPLADTQHAESRFVVLAD